VLLSLLYLLARCVLSLTSLQFRSQRSNDLEIVVLRHELLRPRLPRRVRGTLRDRPRRSTRTRSGTVHDFLPTKRLPHAQASLNRALSPLA
jgi:hypothetical protein